MELHRDSIVVARPIDAVFRFATDPRNDPAWHTTVVAVRQVSPGPIGPGTAFAGSYDSHRRTLETPPSPANFQAIEAVIAELDPPRSSRLRVRFVDAPRGIGGRVLGRSFELTFAFEEVPGGTRITRGGTIHPEGLVRFVLPLFVPLNAGRGRYLLSLLRAAIEAQTDALPGGIAQAPDPSR